MKVKINYSIDFEEVPAEVKRLFEKATKNYADELKKLFEANVNNPTEFVELVENFRLANGDLDNVLAECHGIMGGYLQALVAANVSAVTEVEESEAEDG
jgi:hypothetical protein